MWDIQDTGYSRCGMFEMFRIGDVRDVVCWGCAVFRM